MNADGQKVAVGTAYHQLRLYDTKAQRRPILQLDVGEHPIRSLVINCGCT
jgi:ribosome biogenesis protein NSA1